MHSTLRNMDLNLLLIFDALYRHGTVARAAEELAISPSAFSHALNRLRDTLNDPLFLRTGKRMVPTAKAETMAVVVATALSGLTNCMRNSSEFEPQTSVQSFTFAVTDYTAAVVLPELIDRVNRIAPGISIRLVYSDGFNADEELLSGRVDFALGYEEEKVLLRSGIESVKCLTDDYAVAVRREHPSIGNTLSREEYLSSGHVVVRPWHHIRGAIDRYLESQHVRRRIVVELPSLMIAPVIVSRTDLLLTLPKRGIASVFNMNNLKVFTPPFSTPQYTLRAYFCPALCNSPGHIWMTKQIRETGQALSIRDEADPAPAGDR